MRIHKFQPPPRSLSILSRLMILFGGQLQGMGWFFFFIGMSFFWTFQRFDWIGAAIGLFFAMLGLAGVLWTIRKNIRRIDLLENGIFALGTYRNKKATNFSYNDQTVYEYTFAFEAADGREALVSGRTHLTHLLEGGEQIPCIYAPGNPDYAELYPLIPSAPKIAEDGHMKQVSILNIWKLVLPALSFVVHGGILVFHFL